MGLGRPDRTDGFSPRYCPANTLGRNVPRADSCTAANIRQGLSRGQAETILVSRVVPKGFPTGLTAVARRKLVQLSNAVALGDLAVPPGNKLEALKGNLSGRYSVRINDQWRIVFRWTDVGSEDVEILDCH